MIRTAKAAMRATRGPSVPAPAPARQGSGLPFWMTPHRFVGFVICPIAMFVVISAATFQGSTASNYSTISYVNWQSTGMLFLGLGGIGLGSFLMAAHGRPPRRIVLVEPIALDVLFGLCLAGYGVWFVPLIVSNPEVFLAAIRAEFDAVYAFRYNAPNISGITTLTQFGVAYALLYADARFRQNQRLPRRYDVFFGAIVGLAAIRALANSERIALLEVLMPTLFVFFASRWSLQRPIFRGVRQTFPLLIIVIAPIFFVVFEYNRSWINFYQYRYDSLLDFGLERLSIYYSSAFNNMSGFLEIAEWPTYDGHNTLVWLYRFPVLGSLLGQFIDDKSVSFQLFLELYASEEFNNQTGILPAYQDWGWIGGTIYFLGLGSFYGYGFLCFITQRGWIRHLFPLILFSLFEVLRIDYIVDGRAVAVIIGLILGRVLCRGTPEAQPVRVRGRAPAIQVGARL